jgi:hypothetical protein
MNAQCVSHEATCFRLYIYIVIFYTGQIARAIYTPKVAPWHAYTQECGFLSVLSRKPQEFATRQGVVQCCPDLTSVCLRQPEPTCSTRLLVNQSAEQFSCIHNNKLTDTSISGVQRAENDAQVRKMIERKGLSTYGLHDVVNASISCGVRNAPLFDSSASRSFHYIYTPT